MGDESNYKHERVGQWGDASPSFSRAAVLSTEYKLQDTGMLGYQRLPFQVAKQGGCQSADAVTVTGSQTSLDAVD